MKRTMLAFLGVMSLVAYIQRAAISVPLQEIGHDLALAEPTWWLGLLQSAWQLGYAACQLPAGWVADRFGSRRTLVVGAVLWSLATAATGLAGSYAAVVAIWTTMGMLQAVAFPCAVRTIGRLFADGERARASGWLGAGMLAGAALAPALTAWLLEQVGPWATAEGIDRWRICLVLYAVPGIVWAAAYWMATRTPTIATAPAATAAAAPMQRTTWLRACGDRPLLLLCGQQFLRAAAMIFFVTWFPTFLRETRGVSLMEAGLLTTCAGGAALLGTVLGGYGSDFVLARTGSKRLARQGIAAVGLSACAVLVGASFLVTHVTGALTLISAGAFAAAFGGVAGYTVAMDYGGERVGTVFGAMNTAGNVGAMLFPAAVGWLVTATGTWNSALVLFAVLMVADACLWLILDPQGRFLEPAGPSIKPT